MSDRIIIMCEGRKTGELAIEEANQEKIMQAATRPQLGLHRVASRHRLEEALEIEHKR